MTRRIVIILGHPDPAPERFCRALASSYAEAATAAGHALEIIDLATTPFPFLRTKANYEGEPAPPPIQAAQAQIRAADHIVFIFPLWLGDMPALMKAFLEQAFRPGFAYRGTGESGPRQRLKGKSARVVVTMGMPAILYRVFFRAHALKNLRRNILGFCGVHPVRDSIIGLIERKSSAPRRRWLAKMAIYGQKGE